jgi:hypothetical protein
LYFPSDGDDSHPRAQRDPARFTRPILKEADMPDEHAISRRQLGAMVAGLALAPLAPGAAHAAAPAPAPGLDYVFDLDVQVGPAQELGEYGGGRRRVIPITGGALRGPGLNGVVLPGGADWQTLRPDGLTLLQARYTIRMDEGSVIGVINTGVRRAAPAIARRLAAGEIVDPALYYFRATPVFEVGVGGPWQWLAESLFVSAGERLPELVRLKVYKVG